MSMEWLDRLWPDDEFTSSLSNAPKPKLKRGYATPNFAWAELQCRCGCGAKNICPKALAKLQALRDRVGKPLQVNCAARCPRHNVRVGGAPLSKHRSTAVMQSTAFDISLAGHSKAALIAHAEAAGFKGIGINYKTFIHIDDRPHRARW